MSEKREGTVEVTHLVVKGKMYKLDGTGELNVRLNDDGSLTLL